MPALYRLGKRHSMTSKFVGVRENRDFWVLPAVFRVLNEALYLCWPGTTAFTTANSVEPNRWAKKRCRIVQRGCGGETQPFIAPRLKPFWSESVVSASFNEMSSSFKFRTAANPLQSSLISRPRTCPLVFLQSSPVPSTPAADDHGCLSPVYNRAVVIYLGRFLA